MITAGIREWSFFDPLFFLKIEELDLFEIFFGSVPTDDEDSSGGCYCCEADSVVPHRFNGFPRLLLPAEAFSRVGGIVRESDSSECIEKSIKTYATG